MEAGGPTKPEDDGPEAGSIGQPVGEPFAGVGEQPKPQSLQDLIGTTGTPGQQQPMGADDIHPAPSTSRRSIPSWVSFTPMLTALLFAVLWFFMEGLPFADHDEYGAVPLTSAGDKPNPTVLAIPDGKVYIYFEERGLSDQDSVETPNGLAVEVRPADAPRKSAPLEVEEVPSFLFSTKTDSTGWEPHGKLDTEPGDYSFTATAESSFGQITVGKPPINPFGPPIVGSILIFALGAGATFLIVARRRG